MDCAAKKRKPEDSYLTLKDAYEAMKKGEFKKYRDCQEQVGQQVVRLGDDKLMGEWKLMQAMEEEGMGLERKVALLEEAWELLKGRSDILSEYTPISMWGNLYAAWNRDGGKGRQRMDTAAQAEQLFYRLTGTGKGSYALYRAQLAFFTGELSEAEHYSRQIFEQGYDSRQKKTGLAAAGILLRVAEHRCEEQMWICNLDYIKNAVFEQSMFTKDEQEMALLYLCQAEMSVGLLQNIPAWVRRGEFGVVASDGFYRMLGGKLSWNLLPEAMLTQIQYLIYSDRPAMALQAANAIDALYGVKNILTDAYVAFYRACAYQALGMEEEEAFYLQAGVEKIAPDGLWMIAAEFLPPFGEALLQEVQRHDRQACGKILQLADGLWEKLAYLRKKTQNQEYAQMLSEQEYKIMLLVRGGKTYGEIAQQLGISLRSVKYCMEKIYNKTGISSREELRRLGKTENEEEYLAFWMEDTSD